MAKMMRRRSWVKVTNTYGADYSGDFRGRDQAEFKQLVAEWSDEINEDRTVRESWAYFYSMYPEWYANKTLDWYGIPKPPVTGHRTPE